MVIEHQAFHNLRSAELDGGLVVEPKTTLAIPNVAPDEYVKYRGRHLIDQGVIESYEFHVPYAEDSAGVITYYTNRVAGEAGVSRLAGTFATLAPMVRDYLKARLFERPVELDDKTILRRLSENDAQALVVNAFLAAIRELSIAEREPTIEDSALRVSQTPPFRGLRRPRPANEPSSTSRRSTARSRPGSQSFSTPRRTSPPGRS